MTRDDSDRRFGWFDPKTGNSCSFESIVEKILQDRSQTIHVGTDSHQSRYRPPGCLVRGYFFATVICLYEPGHGGDYYCRRTYRDKKYDSLRHRIMDEVSESVDTSIILMEYVPSSRISVHADINSDARHKTHGFLQQARSWTQSVGFNFLCKPYAWASSGVADRHAK
jgi:predicted RNase H-related nuclease YkuK (DUF458 family)